MIRFEEDRIILTGKTSAAFVKNALCPDPDMVARREAYRPILEQNKIEIRDGCVYADIPDLDIPDEPESKLFTCEVPVSMPTGKFTEYVADIAARSNTKTYTHRFNSCFSEQSEEEKVRYNSTGYRSKKYLFGNEPLDAA